jgi:hypothetical protein
VAKSFTHGLGQIPDSWNLTSWGTGRGAGRFRVTAVGTNMITIVNTVASTCTVDIVVHFWSGQPY